LTDNVLCGILNILLYKDIYNKYYKYIINYKINNKELLTLVEFIKLLYEAFPEKESFTVDDFEIFFKSKNLGLTEKKYVVFNDIFNSLRSNPSDREIAQELLKAYKRQQVLSQISLTAFDVQNGSKPLTDLSALLSEIDTPIETETSEQLFVTNDLAELVDKQVAKRGLRWRINFLNWSLGSLRKGDFGFVFARPETGKTTFLASEVTYMASQLRDEDGPILWFNNEEQGEKVNLRVYQASLGITQSDLCGDIPKWSRAFDERTKSKIRIVDRAALFKGEAERIIREYKPSLILFDQIDKVKGFDSDREDLRLGAIYIWARELAKAYCPVIGVCQADGTGEGQKWLTMDNVANAKTSKQAEADWILGIGKTHDPALEDVRFFNISKNKLSGDDDTVSRLRHGRTEILIEPEIARYRDILQ
jgi:hypothetical protein